jgi:hypothetical protein
MRIFIATFVLMTMLAFVQPVYAASPSWSGWESGWTAWIGMSDEHYAQISESWLGSPAGVRQLLKDKGYTAKQDYERDLGDLTSLVHRGIISEQERFDLLISWWEHVNKHYPTAERVWRDYWGNAYDDWWYRHIFSPKVTTGPRIKDTTIYSLDIFDIF